MNLENFSTSELVPDHHFSHSRESLLPQVNLNTTKSKSKEFHNIAMERPPVLSYTSNKLISLPYPTKYAYAGVPGLLSPFVQITNRMFIVKFLHQGQEKILLVSPTNFEQARLTPYFYRLGQSFGPLSNLITGLLTKEHKTVEELLSDHDIAYADIDFITFDHLHTQSLTKWLGSGDAPGLFPNAKLLVTKKEWQSVQGLLADQLQWYQPGDLKKVADNRIIEFTDDLWVGDSIYLMRTPGHTTGNHSIVVRTQEGLRVTSENGIGPDSYAPKNSSMTAVRRYAENLDLDVVMNGNTFESSVDQYISMVQEKYVSGEYKNDHRFYNIATSSEMDFFWLYPGIKPSFKFGDQQIQSATS